MSSTTITFVKTLVGRFPDLVQLLHEHMDDNQGEVLPHVFFGDFTRYVVSLCIRAHTSGRASDNEQLQSILRFLDQSYQGGDREVQELISVSFLEHLPRLHEAGSEIRGMVGQYLAEQLRVIG